MSNDPSVNAGKRIPELDGLRGLAILLVLVWHYFVGQVAASDFPIMNHLLKTPLSVAWSGVDLFFVLSGFLIGGILIDCRTSPSFFKTFYIRRLCRILPPYYALIGLFVLAAVIGLMDQSQFDWLFQGLHPLWSYATFTQSFVMLSSLQLGGSWFSVTWSLAIEEQFYLVLPLIVYVCSPRKLPYLLAALVLLAPALRALIVFAWPDRSPVNYILMPCRADSLLLGVLAAFAVRVPAVLEDLKSNSRRLYWVLGALLCGVAVIGFGRQPSVSVFMSVFGYAWLAAFYLVVLLICVVEKNGVVSWVCRNSLLRKLGVISYGVYLLHQPMSGLCHGFLRGAAPRITDLNSGTVTLLALFSTLALAKLSFVFFEKPIIGLGHTYRYAKNESGSGGVTAREPPL
jgi:peptidoglycan/LPS O-acetylase OafA/YrhL